jgi:hypothetical protein
VRKAHQKALNAHHLARLQLFPLRAVFIDFEMANDVYTGFWIDWGGYLSGDSNVRHAKQFQNWAGVKVPL